MRITITTLVQQQLVLEPFMAAHIQMLQSLKYNALQNVSSFSVQILA
jgi:hypothetical protein